MSEKRFVLDKLYYTIMTPIEKISVGRNYITYGEVVDLLNKQQATIEMYKRRVNKREEQISIIKKHCLKFLTDEQFKIIRKALEDELV